MSNLQDNRDPERRRSEVGIGTYRVGVFHDWARMLQRISYGKEHRQTTKPIRAFLRLLRSNWKSKSYWNGYLAEWHYPPEDMAEPAAGHGWTRRRALRRLGVIIVLNNLSWQEVTENGKDEVL